MKRTLLDYLEKIYLFYESNCKLCDCNCRECVYDLLCYKAEDLIISMYECCQKIENEKR